MDKKYQIFISSTYEDLIEERKCVTRALLECNCIPAGMELFPASNKKSWDIIKKVIDDSDYYLLIIAGKYGSYGENDEGQVTGYTEMEYDYAEKVGKPIIAFVHDHIEDLPLKKSETAPDKKICLENFRNKVTTNGRNIKFWSNTEALISNIKSSIPILINDTPTRGWMRGDDDYIQISPIINKWQLGKIYNTRAEKNAESDPLLEKHNIKQLDGIAFGLSNFRSRRKNDMQECLNNGMMVRLLVMDPYGEYISQREKEENEPEGKMSNSIIELVKWSSELNKHSNKGKIEIKYYNCMTLDFYWRVDDILYVGPYMLETPSQQTITFMYKHDGKGFDVYTEYFERIWNNPIFCEPAYLKESCE